MFVLLLFILAITLAGVAAAFSIYGLIAIFPAVAVGILIGAIVIEVCKLAAISFFYQFYNVLGWGKKLFAAFFITIAMVITSLGVYGFLTKGYIEQNAPMYEYQLKIENIDQNIITLNKRIERNQSQITMMDNALERYIELGAISKGLQTMKEDYGNDYKILQVEINDYQNQIVELNNEHTAIRGQLNKVEAEIGPIQYIADIFINGDDANLSRDTALKWFSILIVMAIDPFAVALLVFANHAYIHRNNPNVRREFDIFDNQKKHGSIGNNEELDSEKFNEMVGKVESFLQSKEDESNIYSPNSNTTKYDDIVSNTNKPTVVDIVEPYTQSSPKKRDSWIGNKK